MGDDVLTTGIDDGVDDGLDSASGGVSTGGVEGDEDGGGTGGVDDDTSGGNTTGDASASTSEGADGGAQQACPAEQLPPDLPAVSNGSNAGRLDALQGSCGQPGGREMSYEFTAPADGTYRFETTGSSYDTVLYVLDGSDCGGSILSCNDDANGSVQSQLELDLVAGQSVVVIVDGYGAAATGNFQLTVDRAPQPCSASPLGSVAPVSTSGTTEGGTELFEGSCAGGPGPEKVYSWVAPSAGTYTFDTTQSQVDTVLYVFDDPSCLGVELGCNDDADGQSGSRLSLALAAGQEVAIVVDTASGSSGAFTLSIE